MPVGCPGNSNGTSIATGCTCVGEFRGNLIATRVFPFVQGGCVAESASAASGLPIIVIAAGGGGLLLLVAVILWLRRRTGTRDAKPVYFPNILLIS